MAEDFSGTQETVPSMTEILAPVVENLLDNKLSGEETDELVGNYQCLTDVKAMSPQVNLKIRTCPNNSRRQRKFMQGHSIRSAKKHSQTTFSIFIKIWHFIHHLDVSDGRRFAISVQHLEMVTLTSSEQLHLALADGAHFKTMVV